MHAATPQSDLLPWQSADWERVVAAREMGRLPHALLLTGTSGVGKRRFAELLAKSMLCNESDEYGMPCNQCRGCHLFDAGSHPDYRTIEPEEKGKFIKIDAIREFTSSGALTAQAGGFKVSIIEPADAMNTAAANSLLKTLEEPADWTLMILISATPGRLPATIRSRCQQIRLAAPDRESGLSWLQSQLPDAPQPNLLLDLASGAPLSALKIHPTETLALRIKLFEEFAAIMRGSQDPVAVAAEWSKLDTVQVVEWCISWLIDIIRLQADPDGGHLQNSDQRNQLQLLANEIESKQMFRLLDQALEASRSAGAQLNQQMVMEDLLLFLSDGGGFQR